MAAKAVRNTPPPAPKPTQPVDHEVVPGRHYPGIPSWLYSFGVQAAIVGILSVIFYVNTVKNEYALDDSVVIVRNEFVHEGLAGIPDILSKDAYYSYYSQLYSSNQLSGGRYRPLSIVTFAIEQQFFGAVAKGQVDSIIAYGLSYDMQAPYEKKFLHEMHVRHAWNVAWYALAVIALLWFLRTVVFRSDPLMALIAALIFAVHPLHTEVVANVKSRDELMSLLFISLTFVFAFRYRQQPGKKLLLAGGLGCYFLAFLSKEYAITLLALLPLSFYLFNKYTIGKSILATLPYAAVAVLYIFIRWHVIGERSPLSDSDIQINPYALASPAEKLATEIATSLNYLKLLIFPHPLSSDYSYNQIPYKDFGDPIVWLSLLVHLGLLGGFVYFFRKRSVLCFAIAFYGLNLLMVNNFLFDIGATMGERLIFHASVGFAIAVAWLLVKGMERIRQPVAANGALAVLLLLIVVLSGFKTIERNKDWRNDETLFFKDINVVPNSFLVNENVGVMLINRSDFETDSVKRTAELQRGVRLFSRVIGLQDNYVLGYMNRSTAYLKLGMADSMVADLNRVLVLYPIHPQLPAMYYHAGMLYELKGDYTNAVIELRQSLKLNPKAGDAQAALHYADSIRMTLSGPPLMP